MIRLATEAMGTRFELVLANPSQDESFLRAVGEEALDVICDWHTRLSAFDKGSITHLLNTRAAAEHVRVDDEILHLLLACAHTHEQSEGAFDPTIAPLMTKWGFRGEPRPDLEPVFGMDRVAIDAATGTIHFTEPGIALDFGAIAKGHALDAAAEVLHEHRIPSALVHGGTSTGVAIGDKPDGSPWRIQLEPDGPTLELSNRAFSVSAPHGRTIEHEGEKLGHVIDPRSGKPARALPAAATIADSARDADAWSTALLVLAERPATMPSETTSLLPLADGWQVEGRDAALAKT